MSDVKNNGNVRGAPLPTAQTQVKGKVGPQKLNNVEFEKKFGHVDFRNKAAQDSVNLKNQFAVPLDHGELVDNADLAQAAGRRMGSAAKKNDEGKVECDLLGSLNSMIQQKFGSFEEMASVEDMLKNLSVGGRTDKDGKDIRFEQIDLMRKEDAARAKFVADAEQREKNGTEARQASVADRMREQLAPFLEKNGALLQETIQSLGLDTKDGPQKDSALAIGATASAACAGGVGQLMRGLMAVSELNKLSAQKGVSFEQGQAQLRQTLGMGGSGSATSNPAANAALANNAPKVGPF